jgi:hypothetical protein
MPVPYLKILKAAGFILFREISDWHFQIVQVLVVDVNPS